MIETQYFKIKPGRYVRQAFGIWIGQWWWCVLLPIVVLAVAGLYESLYYVAAIGLILIVYPGILALIYFNHALRPEAAFSVLEHKISIDDGQIKITYKSSDDYRVPHPQTIPLSQVETVEDTGSALILHLKGSPYRFIEIPTSVLPAGNLSSLLQLLNKLYV